MDNHEFNKIIEDLSKEKYRRVQSFDDPDGSKFWIKSTEKTSIKHILKGNPRKALIREINAEDVLRRIGFQSSRIVFHSRKNIVFADAGLTLEEIFREKKFTSKIREKIFSQAGEHFAYLHKNQYSHGGLALRDICWDGKKVTFLDFEKFRDNIAKTKKLSVDFYYFVHSWFKLSDKAGPELLSFVNSYKAASDKILWQEILNMPKRYNLLEKISLMVNTKNKDIIAFQRAIEFLKVEN